MNRIILVGNGFDLAHGLATRYEDFINWYWDEWGSLLATSSKKHITDGLCSFKLKDDVGLAGWYLVWGWSYKISTQTSSMRDIVELAKSESKLCDFKVHSIFFAEICKAVEEKGWVDIESEYYKLLNSEEINPENLNREFDIVRNKLIEYLSSIQSSKIHDSIKLNPIQDCIMAPFSAKEIAIEAHNKWIEFIKSRINDEGLIENIKLYNPLDAKERANKVGDFRTDWMWQMDNTGVESIPEDSLPSDMLYPDRIMLLNFNYTNTADMYMPEDSYHFPINHIHGALNNPNSVIFGYGDEMDEKYKEISKLNNNNLLTNIKSIRYLEGVNYRNVLTFIESAPYQIYIMGHSCGTSDRTLLNTLFEHRNCVSIKPYYFQKDNGEDNYMEIVQNISRNFSDAQKMRDRVVNKTFCQPLPQKAVPNE